VPINLLFLVKDTYPLCFVFTVATIVVAFGPQSLVSALVMTLPIVKESLLLIEIVNIGIAIGFHLDKFYLLFLLFLDYITLSPLSVTIGLFDAHFEPQCRVVSTCK
jgi:uncharacterized membrane protein